MNPMVRIAVFCSTALVARAAFAEDTAPPPSDAPPPPVEPSSTPVPEVPAAAPPPAAPPPLSTEELKELEAALAAEGTASAPPTLKLPDLSQVNLASGIPGIQGMNPTIAVTLDFAGAAFSADPLQTGGHDPDHNGFTLRQVELALGASVDPFARLDANLVFKEGVEVEEVFATTLGLPWNLQARVGEFFTHFGRINEQHPHAWRFVDQPLVNGKLLGEDNHHGKGVELSWLAPLPWALTLYGTVQEPGEPCCSVSYSPSEESVATVRSPGDLVYEAALEQFFALGDDLSLLWGLSTQAGPAQYLGEGGRAELQGTDLLLRYQPSDAPSRWSLELQVEAMLRTRHEPGTFLVDQGGYGQLVWRINPEWETGARYEIVHGLEDDAFDETGLGPMVQRGAAQLTYYPSHFSRLRLQGSVGDRNDGSPPVWALVADLEFTIGAHAAHAY